MDFFWQDFYYTSKASIIHQLKLNKMENFNINDMKNLFGPTPINELPGVAGYANYKLNWKLVIGGIAFGSVLTLIIVAAVNKRGKKITYAINGTNSKSKSLLKTEDSVRNPFNDYYSEIE